jgi:hypothetical protein
MHAQLKKNLTKRKTTTVRDMIIRRVGSKKKKKEFLYNIDD